MSFTWTKEGKTLRVGIDETLIVGNRHELKEVVLEQLDRGEKPFVFDFSRTQYIDSSGLGVLISLSNKIRDRRGTLRLVNLNDELQTLFALTKLDRLFVFGEIE